MNQKKYKLKRLPQTGFVQEIDEARFIINYREELNASQF